MSEDKRNENKIELKYLEGMCFGQIYRRQYIREMPWCWNEHRHEGDCEVWYMPLINLPEDNALVCLKWKVNKEVS